MFKQAITQLHTPRDLLRFAVSRFNEAELFFGHGCLNALDEAAYLILHALHLPHDRLDPFLDAKLLPPEVESALHLIEQRIVKRVPAAYLTHEAWLGDFRFYVDERVIVPRSFIAELLREQLAPWVADAEGVTSALDLCTGSGCLAILLAHAFPHAQVDAADLSPDALEVARRNISDYGLAQQVTPIASDLFTALAGRRYDIIVSNPPYVDQAAMAALPQEYRHEPALALASGQDGLDHVRMILKQAPQHLNAGGVLIVELGHHRTELETAFPEIEFTWPEMSAGTDCVFIVTREQLIVQ
ncbi:MAG: 50S ribosomal protein L3 N(5)-glutamine methyltransferase [Hydrogenophilales bacterium]|nr:50S ribosomal protein L3 N(5)-glutamine methyltransferase [Hydrogenophilales bacterium]